MSTMQAPLLEPGSAPPRVTATQTQRPPILVRLRKLPYYILLVMAYQSVTTKHVVSSTLFELWAFVLILILFGLCAKIMLDLYVKRLSAMLFQCGFICLILTCAPAHVSPFFANFGTWILAPVHVLKAASMGSFQDLKPIWRPVLWGMFSYFSLVTWLRIAPTVHAASIEGMSRRTYIWAMALATCVLSLPRGWCHTCPPLQPLWFHSYDCIAAFHSWASGSTENPPSLDKWIAVVLLVWWLLATILAVPTMADITGVAFDEREFFKQTMKKGVFHATMQETSNQRADYLRLLRKTSTRILGGDAATLETLKAKRQRLVDGCTRRHGGRVPLQYRLGPVVRERLLETSLELLRTASDLQLLSKRFAVGYEGEQGIDAGGVTRDWYDSLAKALLEGSEQQEDGPRSSLLSRTTEGTLLPRPSSYPDDSSGEDAPEELHKRWAHLGAIGRFLGVALLQNHPLPLSFGNILMKILCEQEVSYRDVCQLDPDFYKYRIAMILEDGGLQRAEEAACEPLTFVSAPTEKVRTQQPLMPGGDKRRVTEENKMEYIKLLSEARICNGRRRELRFFIEGFHEVIPADLLKEAQVSPQDLSMLISGIHEYNVAEWRTSAEQKNSTKVTQWFWEVVEDFNDEQKGKLLQFTTGTSRLPACGFKDLDPPFKIEETAESVDHLPTSHTCFNHLCMPKYASREELEDKLKQALAVGSDAGFGFA